ncbi:MAG TPA: hypothetical protein PK283_06755 [Thiotrichales bacterium]|nr:hypothetical protein [Thiotrichales bacterium]HQR96884.1 hypothetical protein [Thiotrichales bacterium]
MLDQICNYQNDLDASIQSQRHPFVGEAISSLAKKSGLTLTHFRNGTRIEDKMGGDIVAHFAETQSPLYIDLKITSNANSKRSTLEIQRGHGQLGTPWSVDGSKGDIVLWVHTKERIAYFALRKRLAEAITNPTAETKAFLSSGQVVSKITSAPSGTFESVCHLYDRPTFINWLKQNGIGGAL